MEELLQKLQQEHGLSLDQARGILGTISSYVKEKFPMLSGAIDNLIPTGSGGTSTATGGDLLDKISDFIPGEAGEKMEEFAKQKLGGFFGESKEA
ncbi:MAG: hypothetical protein KGM98_12635 [Bacteroidota bacterium]|nr:hypothetical protein [Bacteroidota bacterium]